MNRHYEANIWKFYVFQFVLNFQLWWPIWVLYLTEKRGLTLGQVTLMDVPFWLSIMLLQIPAAAIADRWGRKPTLLASALCLSAAVTLFGLASSFPLLLLSYLVWGTSLSLLFGTESAFLYDTLKALGREEDYSRMYGRAWGLVTAATLGGTLLGAPLAAETDLALPILLSAAIASLAVLVALAFAEPKIEGAVRRHLTYTQVIRESVQIVRRQPAVRYGILFFGLIAIGSTAPIFFFQPFLREHDIGLGAVGFWQTPSRIAGIIGAVAAYRIIAFAGERQTFYLMPLVIVLSYVALAAWDSLYAQVAFISINFVAFVSQPAVTDYLNRRVPTEQRATVISLTNLVRSAILIPVAPLLGALAEESLAASFWAGAALVATLGLPLMLAWSPYLRRDAPLEPELPQPAGVPGGD